MRLPSVLPWILSFTIIAVIAALHVNLLWIIPTVVWTFIISVFLLRALLPSATDHKMLGYLNAPGRPMGRLYLPIQSQRRRLPPTKPQVAPIAGREKEAPQSGSISSE
jgi:hypothetical protein